MTGLDSRCRQFSVVNYAETGRQVPTWRPAREFLRGWNMDVAFWAIEFAVFLIGMLAGVCLWEWERIEDESDPPIIETAWGKVR